MDQSSGALESSVHPHRPWSKSHTLSDDGEEAGKNRRQQGVEEESTTAASSLCSELTLGFLLSPVVVTGTVEVSVLGGGVGVTVLAGVLISTETKPIRRKVQHRLMKPD